MRIWGVFLFFTIPRDKTKSKICRKTCLLRNNGCEDWVILQKNNIMTTKIIKIVGSIVISIIMSYILWIIYFYAIPFVMNIGWKMFILYIILFGGLITAIISHISAFLYYPLILVSKGCKIAKYASIPFIFYFVCLSPLKLPYSLNIDFSALQWILAISLNILSVTTFISIIIVLFNINKD